MMDGTSSTAAATVLERHLGPLADPLRMRIGGLSYDYPSAKGTIVFPRVIPAWMPIA